MTLVHYYNVITEYTGCLNDESTCRDAKFRLGIMTLMSMSVILLAIVEDMPKFSMVVDKNDKFGSKSGIPLIGETFSQLVINILEQLYLL